MTFKMKTNGKVFWCTALLTIVGFQTLAFGASESPASTASQPASLEDQLNALSVPGNTAPVSISNQEKLYAVQSRYSPLQSTSEFTIYGGHAFAGDSMLNINDMGLAYRFHFNDRFSLAATGSFVFNTLSGAGDRLLNQENLLPDVAFARNRVDLTATYNLFYGKFRLGMDQAFYFDQFLSLGAGMVWMGDNTKTNAWVGEAGLAFWLGKRYSARISLKDYFYNEQRMLTTGMTHNILGTIGFGILLGGDRS